MVSPRRPSSAPGRRRRPTTTLSNRDGSSSETRTAENLDLKRQLNGLAQELVNLQGANARLAQQNSLQSKQIESLLGGGETVAIRRHHERSLIVKRLREQLECLRSALKDRDETIADLRKSHRNTMLLELEAAKEEYYAEILRLRESKTTKRRKAARSGFIADDDGSHESGCTAAPQQDALRLLYDEARTVASTSLATGFGVVKSSAVVPKYTTKNGQHTGVAALQARVRGHGARRRQRDKDTRATKVQAAVRGSFARRRRKQVRWDHDVSLAYSEDSSSNLHVSPLRPSSSSSYEEDFD